MNPRVYVETTVISYLTARPARDVVVAGHQQSTRDWWTTAADRYELVVSELVRKEAGMGDPDRGTSPALSGRLTCDPRRNSRSRDMPEVLVRTAAVPQAAIPDAAHIAVAAASGVEYLVTWNFRHIANAVTRPLIESACRRAGCQPAVICTPEELMEDPHDEK